MNILDIIIIIYILVEIYLGYSRGAVKSLFNVFGYFASAVITFIFYQPFKMILMEKVGLDKAISGFVKDRLISLGASGIDASVSQSDLSAMGKLPLPDTISKGIEKFLISSAEGVAETVTSQVTEFVVTVISIVVLFLAIIMAVKIIGGMLNAIVKLPIINNFNHALGIVFGVVKAYIILSIVILILISLLSMNKWDVLQAFVDTSFFTNFFIQKNVFILFFSYLPAA